MTLQFLFMMTLQLRVAQCGRLLSPLLDGTDVTQIMQTMSISPILIGTRLFQLELQMLQFVPAPIHPYQVERQE